MLYVLYNVHCTVYTKVKHSAHPLKINFLVTPHISFLVARKHAESTAEVEAEYTGEEYTGDIPNARRISSGRQVNKPGRFTE